MSAEESPENGRDQNEHEDGQVQRVRVQVVVGDDRPYGVARYKDLASERLLVLGGQG